MTRGKCGQSAAVRHEAQSHEQEVADYRRAVMRLTSERNTARAELAEHRKTTARTERELRARLNAGAAPQIDVLNAMIAALKEDRDNIRQVLAAVRSRRDAFFLSVLRTAEAEGVPPGVLNRIQATVRANEHASGSPAMLLKILKESAQNYGGEVEL